MNRLFAMFRYSKKLLAVSILIFIDLLCMFGIIVFDVVQLIMIKVNAASLLSVFIPFNIVLIALAVINLLLVISFIIINKLKEKNDEFKKD